MKYKLKLLILTLLFSLSQTYPLMQREEDDGGLKLFFDLDWDAKGDLFYTFDKTRYEDVCQVQIPDYGG
jgi:hypothetical protein